MKSRIFSIFLAIFVTFSFSSNLVAFKLTRPTSNQLTLTLRLSPDKIYLLVFMDGPGFRGFEKPETVKILFWDSKNDLVIIDPSSINEDFSIEILLKEWEGSLNVYLSGNLGATWKHIIVFPNGTYQLPIEEDANQRPSFAPARHQPILTWGQVKGGRR